MLDIVSKFRLKGTPIYCERYGNGHINKTYRMICDSGFEYILQRINKNVFKDPIALMNNISMLTNYIKKRIRNSREVLTLVPTLSGQNYQVDEEGEYWRTYDFVTDSICIEQVEHACDFYQSALAFGKFQDMLSEYPAHTLNETIPGFHDTVSRYAVFKKAIKADVCGSVDSVRPEIDFVLSQESFASTLMNLLKAGELPLRVTHNDTKLNNVLFDRETRKGVCVIDFDTIMSGVITNDFGEAIRFGASTATEDEKDLSKVEMDIKLYTVFVKGFLEACGKNLTKKEIELLPVGAKMMTLENGVRFLTDYLSGDTYFKIHYSDQNLDRCRTQFKLVSDMDNKWGKMNEIIFKEAKILGL